MHPIAITGLRARIEKSGWKSLDESFWERLEKIQPQIAFIAPPFDAVPSKNGHAIYTIIQELTERSPIPSLVLSISPGDEKPQPCSISDRILYCTKPFRNIPLEEHLPYRLKKSIWGIGDPRLLHFAEQSARLCGLLEIKKIIIEDTPRFGLVFSKKNSKAAIYLHQHIDATLKHAGAWWRKIKAAYRGTIFVARKTLVDTEQMHGKLENATYIYNGVNLQHFDPLRWKDKAEALRKLYGINQTDSVLLYIGRIIPGKGCLELARAFLKADVVHSKLVIVGDLNDGYFSKKGFTNELISLQKGNSERIILPGAIPQDQIPCFYTMADVVVVPSVQSEGLPKVITEALAMGKPVLTSDRGGSLELVKPGINGWLLENPVDIDQFASQIKTILEDREKILQYGNYALKNDRPNLDIDLNTRKFFEFVLNDKSS